MKKSEFGSHFDRVLATVVHALPGVPASAFASQLLDIADRYDVPRQGIHTWLAHRTPKKDWSINGFERWCVVYRRRRNRLLDAMGHNQMGEAALCPKCGMALTALRGERLSCPNCHTEAKTK